MEVIEDRYNTGSTVITSQLPVKEWHDFIGDPTIADAVCDRLFHTAHVIELKGGSMRKRQLLNNYCITHNIMLHLQYNVLIYAHNSYMAGWLLSIIGGGFVMKREAESLKENRTSEDSLIEEIQILKILFDNVRECLFYIDINSKDRYSFKIVNSAFLKTTGLKASQIVGKMINEVIPEPSLSLVLSNYREAIENKKEVTWEETTPYPSGIKVGEVTVAPVFDKQGACTNLIGTVYDITARKKLELENERLRQDALNSLSTFAGGISHEFNNLLTVIKGYSEIAKVGIEKESQLYESLHHIDMASNKAAHLTRQLLLFSRKIPSNYKETNINMIITKMQNKLSSLLGKTTQIEYILDPNLLESRIDISNINQVIENLISNANDAMPDGGVITIITENLTLNENNLKHITDAYPGKYVVMTIQDNGIGMSKDTLKRIFEPFFTSKGIGKGTGLGLSVVQGIIKQHNGLITVESEPHKGSCFKVYIPAIIKI